MIFTRPWAAKHLNKNRLRTNYESKIGEIIKITERVDNLRQTGRALWTGRNGQSARTKTVKYWKQAISRRLLLFQG